MCVRVCDDVCAGVFGNVDAVRSWVASGADINVVDEDGATPLMFASRGLHTECVAEMLRLGADARRVDNFGHTALYTGLAVVVEMGEELCGSWLRRGVTLRCVTTTATRLSSWHALGTVPSGRLCSRGGLRRRWRE